MKNMPEYPKTGTQLREEAKRQGPGSHPGKAGRVNQKGGAPTSNKARGGKRAK
jgi:hypothetical protein